MSVVVVISKEHGVLVNEFSRWLESGRLGVWKGVNKNGKYEWKLIDIYPSWAQDCVWVVDDDQAEFRKLAIENPKVKFEYLTSSGEWVECIPNWNITTKYRLKKDEWYFKEEYAFSPVWVKNNIDDNWDIDVFINYLPSSKMKFVCNRSAWKYAKLVYSEEYSEKCGEC